MVKSAAHPQAPGSLRCPRCAYDVSGPVPTWADACPVEGACTECGLTFRWGDVWEPLRDVPPWFFELAERQTLRKLISTSLRPLAPWHFWAAVRMEFPMRSLRLATLCTLAAIGVYATGALLQIIPVWVEAMGRGATVRQALEHLVSLPMLLHIFGWPMDNEANGFFVVWLVPSLIMPLAFVLLPDTLGSAKARPAHFVRATAYTLVPIPFLCLAAHVLRVAAGVIVAIDAFGWHLRLAPGGLWAPPPNFAAAILETLAWDHLLWPLLWPLWMLVMWWCICRLYLRLRHAFLTAFLLLLISFLVPLAAMTALGAVMRFAS